MDFSRFFIDRPIFAAVLSILIFVAGVIAIPLLPISEYPDVVPPSVQVRAEYPGANPKEIAETVATPLEEAINGVENMMYVKSVAGSDGVLVTTVTFRPGTDPDQAQVQVQNRVAQAEARLPEDVRRQGITTQKQSPALTLVVHLVSPSGKYDSLYLRNYATLKVKDELARLPGVGQVQIFGAGEYAMRIWLDPNKVAARGLTASDVVSAMQEQNVQVSAGQLGAEPMPTRSDYLLSINAQGRLQTEEEFGNIILKSGDNGEIVRLRDVARIEMGSGSYALRAQLNNKDAVGIGIFQSPGANAIELSDAVRGKMAELATRFPDGMSWKSPYDPTVFVRDSIRAVVDTLLEAVILVVLVVILFLQTWRASIIPLLAVPISVVGTFAALYLLGFSLNTLSLFGLVLAIGIVVDDAIVVVENVERVMSEEGLPPREATRKSMGQIQSALVGIALVLSAVFVPMAFFGGTTGAIYRQFSITIVSAMVLSVLVAMILTPALCATLLKPIAKGHHHGKRGFFGWFNRMFNRNADRYERGVGRILHASGRYMVIYLLLLGGMALLFIKLPTSFLPQEDRGIFTVQVQLPAGSTLQQTSKVVEKVERYFLTEEKQDVLSVFAIIGSGPGGNGQNVARLFVRLKDWDLRTSGANSSFDIIDRATLAFNKINEARVIASSPPAITGLGNSSGFDMELEDHAGLGHAKLMAARDQLLQLAAQNPLLSRVRHNGLDDSPQLQIDIDQRKAQALGVSIDDINNTLSTAWGSTYVNDFVDRGRVKKVYVQAAAPFRMLPDDINKWYVRNSAGGMVPFSAFASSHWEYGSPRLERYNGSSALEIVGEAANGVSTGTAMAEMEKLVSQLPTGFGLEWTAMSYQERLSGSQAPALYAISLLVVFLCLAALYESWSIPFSVMLVVPLGVIGAVAATWLRGLENDVYFQVGLLTIIGLSAKNAILIVEFARELEMQGKGIVEAALEACRLRLRPIVMTSIAFIAGTIPLILGHGAGAEVRGVTGITVFSGMLGVTLFGLFLTPVFYVTLRRLVARKAQPQTA
ncbi:multidrug efflux RND transporter permease subunit [Serratia marcescens]|uniref:efflux RND transporter permease subunit n=1 Tax=Serratia marcescens TaxID=615 RepID=UPI000F7D9214|nr:efflux RND transporter permease subunit [Serratia marcescens]RTF58344.1 multidrug efflux RND transporter permease subunit [Serratia marcescens]